jgi:hypothetical protein
MLNLDKSEILDAHGGPYVPTLGRLDRVPDARWRMEAHQIYCDDSGIARIPLFEKSPKFHGA